MAVFIRDLRLSRRFSGMKMFSTEGKHRSGVIHINVTALVDMMTVLVIFLVMQFSATGEMLFISKDMKMAGAEHGDDVQRAPILSLSSKGDLYFEGNMLEANLSPIQPDDDMMIPSLSEQLIENKKRYEALDLNRANKQVNDDAFVNVQIDESVDFGLIKRVLYTCEKAGYGRIRLAVGNEAKSEKPREIQL